MTVELCRKRYGKNRRVCQKPKGHKGPHAVRKPLWLIARQL